MFEQMKALSSMMKNAGAIKEKVAQFKAELENKRVEAESGGGAVRVVMTGKARVVRIEINDAMMSGLAGDDKVIAEELIAAAVNGAMDKVQQMVAEEIQKISGGMDIPGLSNLLEGGL